MLVRVVGVGRESEPVRRQGNLELRWGGKA